MAAFDRLHPDLRHQVVNALGWRSLRPVQEQSIDGILDEANLLVLAPTAGGKAEAAFFPLISAAMAGGWGGLSTPDLGPIKALLNNQQDRLGRYYGLVGRRAAPWHGDVPAAAKKRMLEGPPDCLLTTPESLEVMLISPSIRHDRLFADVRAVVVDEVHAFARDDRGWHLLALLARICRLAGRDIQRVGLSATVGNEGELLDWLSSGSGRPRRVNRPPAVAEAEPEVVVDYVGGLDNAATVIAALHRGEKRLVFCDSRSRVEQLAAGLRARGVATSVSHSSRGLDERRRAERAFAEGRGCVIVATSALELGIDVGDLDRVVQVDAPGTVSSFLQRMGRTGRRPGQARNCTFLATDDAGLVRDAGLVELWRTGYVEPAAPPPEPLHILAQQVLALALQEGGIGRADWTSWVGQVPAFRDLDRGVVGRILDGMLDRQVLWDEAGVLWLGREGQDTYGRKNFLDLISVFTAPPLFAVLHGRHELGSVDKTTFLGRRDDGPPILLLAGRAWRVKLLDWRRRRAHVEPAEDAGRSRWRGGGQLLGHDLGRAIGRLLAGGAAAPGWSRRAIARMESVRSEYPWLPADGSNVMLAAGDEAAWWTFAGGRANAALAHALATRLDAKVTSDNFAARLPPGLVADAIGPALDDLRRAAPDRLVAPASERAIEGLKFSDCLPPEFAARVVRARLADAQGVASVLRQTTRSINAR